LFFDSFKVDLTDPENVPRLSVPPLWYLTLPFQAWASPVTDFPQTSQVNVPAGAVSRCFALFWVVFFFLFISRIGGPSPHSNGKNPVHSVVVEVGRYGCVSLHSSLFFGWGRFLRPVPFFLRL